LNWFDNKLNQFQALSKLVSKTPSVFVKHFFSKGFDLNQLWILTKSGFTNPNYPEPTHTSNSKAFNQSSWISRHQISCSTISPYLMKTNTWFAYVVLFEFQSTCKTNKMHVPKGNHIQVSLAPMNYFSPCDFHKENQQNHCEKPV